MNTLHEDAHKFLCTPLVELACHSLNINQSKNVFEQKSCRKENKKHVLFLIQCVHSLCRFQGN